MLPIDVMTDYGKWIGYFVFFVIGFGFGSVLEKAGFGDSRKLAAQFYFRDMTVLKTMFSGILVACLLIFLTSAMGYLDFSKIFVNQTYLWPGIVGGLIMGVGFITGGYCPGTSMVSAASLKVDGILFFLGTMIGAGIFGETVEYFSDFWNSSYTELYLLSDWLGWSIGGTVFGVTVMALAMFYGAEKAEEYFRSPQQKFNWRLTNGKYQIAASIALVISLVIWGLGQPDPERKWSYVGGQYESLLTSREVFVHPLEYVKTWNDASIKLVTLDLRPKEEFEKFHLDSAKKIELTDLMNTDVVNPLLRLPPQGVVVIVSNQDAEAIQAWKWLKAQGVVNLYILEDGLTQWFQLFADKVDKEISHEKFNLARPTLKVLDLFPKDSFTTKIKLKTNKRGGGLCS